MHVHHWELSWNAQPGRLPEGKSELGTLFVMYAERCMPFCQVVIVPQGVQEAALCVRETERERGRAETEQKQREVRKGP